QFRKLRSDYRNLSWSCGLCNGSKSDDWPSPEEESEGVRMLDPVSDRLSEHVAETSDHELEALTDLGQYYIETLDLNSTVHVRRGADRVKHRALAQQLRGALAAAGGGHSEEKLLLSLLEVIDERLPADPPASCLCSKPARQPPSHLRLVKN